MEVATQKFIRKPLYVDAVRVSAQNFDDIVTWCQGEVQTDEVPGTGTTKKFIKVRVHNPKNPRQTKAFIGDWLLYTERGYKVYTNKAFRAAFDQTDADRAPLADAPPVVKEERVETKLIPKFYLSPHSDELMETPPYPDAKPLAFGELMNIVRNELVGGEFQNSIEDSSETGVKTTPDNIPNADSDDDDPVEEELEIVPATPQAIADVVNEQQPMDPPENVVEKTPEDAAAGKRVLSEREQNEMGPDEVRELVRSGEAILAQDLAETS